MLGRHPPSLAATPATSCSFSGAVIDGTTCQCALGQILAASPVTPTHPIKILPYLSIVLMLPSIVPYIQPRPLPSQPTTVSRLPIETPAPSLSHQPLTLPVSALQGQRPATSHYHGMPTQTLPRPSMNSALHTRP
ncbi:hypothetical protein BDR04DRAFT_1147882 [Suillus decipiens]|nr:hypothetical protein BDR04DRAFT_1147882 [Suillus decipiens]